MSTAGRTDSIVRRLEGPSACNPIRRIAMQELELRALIEDVRAGQLPRRGFIQRMVGARPDRADGVEMLMHAGVAQAQPALVVQADQARRRRRR